MSRLACSIASRSLRAKPAWSTVSSDFRFSRRRCGTIVAHIELATSPDTSPPIPSATSSSKPSAPRVWLQREAARQSSPVERLKITKVSSLFLRTRPISERPKALTSIRALSELASRLTSPLPCYLPHPERRCPLDDPLAGLLPRRSPGPEQSTPSPESTTRRICRDLLSPWTGLLSITARKRPQGLEGQVGKRLRIQAARHRTPCVEHPDCSLILLEARSKLTNDLSSDLLRPLQVSRRQ